MCNNYIVAYPLPIYVVSSLGFLPKSHLQHCEFGRNIEDSCHPQPPVWALSWNSLLPMSVVDFGVSCLYGFTFSSFNLIMIGLMKPAQTHPRFSCTFLLSASHFTSDPCPTAEFQPSPISVTLCSTCDHSGGHTHWWGIEHRKIKVCVSKKVLGAVGIFYFPFPFMTIKTLDSTVASQDYLKVFF